MGILKSREKVKRLIHEGQAEEILKGELVIESSVVQGTLSCERVGFEERNRFIKTLGLDLVTVSAHTQSMISSSLANPEDVEFTDLQRWVTETDLFVFGILDGAFERGMRSWEFEEFFRIIKTSPLTLQEWLCTVEKYNLSLVQRLEAEGTNGIILADDVAFAGGLMVHPQILKEHFIPSLLRQVERIKQLGLTVFYHSDGNYRRVLEDIIQVGFDGLHCIDRNSGMEITAVHEEIRDRLCLWGHLDIQDLEDVLRGPEAIEQKVKSIQRFAHGKRFLLGTNSGLFEGMDIEALKELYQRL